MMTCCIFDSSVINLAYSEPQLFSHNRLNISPLLQKSCIRPDPSQIEGVKGEMVQPPKCQPDKSILFILCLA